MTPEQAARLRAPFPPEAVGKLPKPTAKDNKKGTCAECGKWHGLPAVHLDYVGHAAVTDRLLQVDPEWTWRPMACDERGFPVMDATGGLWILLTVAGTTRPGYGDQTMGKGMKEVIGDAIRNAAMRFGVALDLWSKEDLHAEENGHDEQRKTTPLTAEPAGPAKTESPRGTAPPAPPQSDRKDTDPMREAALSALRTAIEAAGVGWADVEAYAKASYRRDDRQRPTSMDEVPLRLLPHLRGQVANGSVAEWLMKQGHA